MDTLGQQDQEILKLIKKRIDDASSNEPCLLTDVDRMTDTAADLGLNPSFVRTLFTSLNRETRQVRIQHLIAAGNPGWCSYRTASYLGPVGTYSYQALKRYSAAQGREFEEVPCTNFRDQVNNVRRGITDLAFLPVENTSSGMINDALDLLNDPSVAVIGEVVLHIVHSLLMNHPENAPKIRFIYSHPQPIVQCSNFLRSRYPEVEYVYCDSTADAIRQVKELNSDEAAAIGSDMGGRIFGLAPVISNIANQKANYTRFVVIAREGIKLPPDTDAKTSISFTTANEPGALSKILDTFRKYNYNMTKLTSRPIIGRPWEEQFYADFKANLESPDAQKALDEIRGNCRSLHVLGCYPVDQGSSEDQE